MSELNVPSGWIRGVLEPCLLALVGDGEAYGYELASRLEAAGLGRVKGGSLYPALTRLEKQGLLSADWRAGEGGPGRKYYVLTRAGRDELDAQSQVWSVFAGRVADVMGVEVDR